jgi:hypothetical protein
MNDRPFVCSCGERYYSREDRQACESVHKVTTLEYGGEVWVRLSAVRPMQDKIIALESKLEAVTKERDDARALLLRADPYGWVMAGGWSIPAAEWKYQQEIFLGEPPK